MPQPLPCLAAARARAYTPDADRTDVQRAVRSSAGPFSKAAATLPPSWHRGRRVRIDVGSETVSAVAALMQGLAVPAHSYSSRAKPAGAAVVIQ
jgi:hypothetical protein